MATCSRQYSQWLSDKDKFSAEDLFSGKPSSRHKNSSQMSSQQQNLNNINAALNLDSKDEEEQTIAPKDADLYTYEDLLVEQNEKALTSLTMALSPKIAHGFMECTSAKQLWDALIQMHERKENMRESRKDMLRQRFNIFNHILEEYLETQIYAPRATRGGKANPSLYARESRNRPTILSLAIVKPSGDLSIEFFSIVDETERNTLGSLRVLHLRIPVPLHIPSPIEPEFVSSVSPLFSVQFMQHTCLQGSPDFEAYSEPERELRERSRKFRSRLSELVEKKVRIPIPIADMGDANPPAMRTVHQRACDGFTGARSSITRPALSKLILGRFHLM
ncbi:hypothetical protein L1987_18742 [Smallanthus sonchifolius]|uniref:Uncharacterized protein n=1 Tax=Smallanthus sonchifolius TaxID=185202 RepID=A0ACB9J236_9ASTR|nr:hypothetical protein L1987_18742 [Smallanthus sonchifolius]